MFQSIIQFSALMPSTSTYSQAYGLLVALFFRRRGCSELSGRYGRGKTYPAPPW